MQYECVYKAVCVHLKFSDHEEQIEIDSEPLAEMPVLDLRLSEEEETQTLDLDEGFGEFDSGSNEHAELLKEKKVDFNILFISVCLSFQVQNVTKTTDCHDVMQNHPLSCLYFLLFFFKSLSFSELFGPLPSTTE